MPCNSDYMRPSPIEISLSKVLAILGELDGRSIDPKTYGSGFGAGYNNADKETLDRATAQLCERLKAVDVTKLSLEAQMWWRDHQIADAERIERQKRIYSEETLRKAALRKLSPEELKALGVEDDPD